MLFLFNTLTHQKEEFVPIQDKNITLYACGITPYDTTHIGHAFTYLAFDTLVRYLKYLGNKVTYTQNVTDINDRDNDILKRAKDQNIPWQQLSTYWTDLFLTDMAALNWIKPTNYLKASENIEGMVGLIQRIIDNGIGYEMNGSIYLDTSKVTDFGKLSHLAKDEMMIKAKEFEEDITNPDKRNPLDITLWRTSTVNQPIHIPSFPSPWGTGRPGWHLECSSMSMSTLGEQIDIHGGGLDLIYPHHESEIAQSESASGKKPFVKYWLHTGVVYKDGKKMSKSLGNLEMVSNLLKKYSPNAIRWTLLSHHYREAWEYKEQDVMKAEQEIQELVSILGNFSSQNVKNTLFMQQIEELLNDDLQVQKVLALVQSEAQKLPTVFNQEIKNSIITTLSLLGFTL